MTLAIGINVAETNYILFKYHLITINIWQYLKIHVFKVQGEFYNIFI